MSGINMPNEGDAFPPPSPTPQAPPPTPPPTPSGVSQTSPTNTSRGSGCAPALGVLLLIGGIVCFNFASSFDSSCSSYPDDGYCSLQELVSGAGWVLVIFGVLALVRVARDAKTEKKKNP